MTLYLIGLGLGDEKDITLRGLEIIKHADVVFLEYYTSLLGVSKQTLEEFYKKPIHVATRELVEQHTNTILEPAKTQSVALLVVGDPFGATTHADIVLRAQKENIAVEIIHNTSIINAVGQLGLELYKYGKTTSVPFHESGFEPQTPYDVIKENKQRGLHTLCLLDIKVNEPTKEQLLKSIAANAKPRFMTVHTALEILLKIESQRKEQVIKPSTFAIGIARLAHLDQYVRAATIQELLTTDFGGPLHSLIIPGTLHDIEQEMIKKFM